VNTSTSATTASPIGHVEAVNGNRTSRASSGRTGSPLGTGIVDPTPEVFGNEAERPLVSANTNRRNTSFLGSVVEPRPGDAGSGGYLCRLQELDQVRTIAVHMVTDPKAS
jgi:hypothetical protein